MEVQRSDIPLPSDWRGFMSKGPLKPLPRFNLARCFQSREPSYRNPFYSGLLTPEHYKKMRGAIWTFFWCVDRTTNEYEDENEVRWGKVLGNKPVTYQEIAKSLGIHWRTIQDHINRLKEGGYIRIRQHPRGLNIEIRNSRKFVARLTKNCDPKFQSNRNLLVQDSQGNRNLFPDSQKSVNQFPANICPPTGCPSYHTKTIQKEYKAEQTLPIFQCEFFMVDRKLHGVLIEAYPGVDLEAEYKKMRAWLEGNPSKRKKGKRGYRRFVQNWIAKAKPSLEPQYENVTGHGGGVP